ncbi:hypothetical protein [Saccharopolyspora sp. NPDC049357]
MVIAMLLSYEPPIGPCAQCTMPTSGVFCLSCATRFRVMSNG